MNSINQILGLSVPWYESSYIDDTYHFGYFAWVLFWLGGGGGGGCFTVWRNGGHLLEHLESSGSRIMMQGLIVRQLRVGRNRNKQRSL